MIQLVSGLRTLVKEELLTLPEHLRSPNDFSRARLFILFHIICLLIVFFMSLYCLSFDVWLLCTLLISLNVSF